MRSRICPSRCVGVLRRPTIYAIKDHSGSNECSFRIMVVTLPPVSKNYPQKCPAEHQRKPCHMQMSIYLPLSPPPLTLFNLKDKKDVRF